jgi:hypothetical protein
MANELNRHKCRSWKASIAALALASVADMAYAHANVVATIDGTHRISIESTSHRSRASLLGEHDVPLRLDARLASALARSENVFVVGKHAIVDGGNTWLLLVVQTPSRPDPGPARCGAGTEDTLHLVKLDRNQATLVDSSRLLIQSCLQTLDLDDNSGQSLQQRLEAVDDPARFTLRWLDHPVFNATHAEH